MSHTAADDFSGELQSPVAHSLQPTERIAIYTSCLTEEEAVSLNGLDKPEHLANNLPAKFFSIGALQVFSVFQALLTTRCAHIYNANSARSYYFRTIIAADKTPGRTHRLKQKAELTANRLLAD